MKRVVFGIVGAIRRVGLPLLAVLLTAGAATGQEWADDILQEESGSLQATVGVTWDSKYIWRGFDIFDDESVTHMMVDLNLWNTGFGVGVVGHRANTSGFEDRERWDGTAYYQGSLGAGDVLATHFRIGYVYYYYPELNSGESLDMQEGQLVLAWPNLLPVPGLQPSYALIAIGQGETPSALADGGSGLLHIGMLDYSFATPGLLPWTDEQIFILHSELIYNSDVTITPARLRNDWTVVYANPPHAFTNVVFGASTDFALDPDGRLLLTPSVYYQITMDNAINEDDSEFWVSVGLKYTF
jgi:hypothetical protein